MLLHATYFGLHSWLFRYPANPMPNPPESRTRDLPRSSPLLPTDSLPPRSAISSLLIHHHQLLFNLSNNFDSHIPLDFDNYHINPTPLRFTLHSLTFASDLLRSHHRAICISTNYPSYPVLVQSHPAQNPGVRDSRPAAQCYEPCRRVTTTLSPDHAHLQRQGRHRV